MNARTFLVGFGAGFAAGYAACRALQAATLLSTPVRRRSADAAAYGATRRAFALAGIARTLASGAAIAYGPAGRTLEHSVRRAPSWMQPVLFSAQTLALESIVDLPIDFVEDYAIEHSYDLSNQSRRSWLSDTLKQHAIALIIFAPLSGLLAAVMRRAPRAWPYLASAAVFPLLVLANVVLPVYIMPLFNEYRPLEGPLERRLRALAARFGVGDAEILRVDMSKQTKKANAFVVGIGRTHRIVVADTLIEHFPEEEIEFVVAHELGHYVSRDTWRMIAGGQLAAMFALFAASLALRDSLAQSPAKSTNVAKLQWIGMLAAQTIRPAISAYARSREWAADRFALAATRDGKTGAAAFRRLRDQNLAEDEQPAWFEFIFSTHPSLKARIENLDEHG